jgi:multidrug efflux pump subunit AcrB
VTGLSLKNPIAILMISIALCVFSFVVTPRMAIDTFPELTPPVLVVGTQAPGLGPKDVEKTITWRIEKYVSATPGVDHVESVSRNGLSIVYVWLKWGTDLNSAQTLVQQQTAFAMSSVPKSLGVLPPFVLQYDPTNAPVVQVALFSGAEPAGGASAAGAAGASVPAQELTGPQLYDYAQNYVEPILEGIPGVASAAVDGGRLRQINIIVDPVRAQSRGVTSSDIAAAVAKSNALLPSGEFISVKFDANVYTNGVPERVKQIGDAAVKSDGDKIVLIRDVATVEDGGAPETQAVSINGQNGVYLNVLRVPGGNTLQIVEAVNAAVEGIRPKLLPGMQIKAIFDQSTFVRTSYHGLKQEVGQALVLIALVIMLFLQSLRGTLIVSVAIPLSFAITLIVLYATGQTLNAFTLGGLTLAMGRLVDDAVVVLESIHRHQRMGLSPYESALRGANAVALPVLASTLTTMAVLLPVVLLAGLAKKLFAPLAITVAVAMIASYFVSMTVTPIACRYFLGHSEHGRFGKAVEAFIDRIASGYSQGLRAVLPWRKSILAACLVLVAGSVWISARLPSTFFPEIDESMETIYVRTAPGTPLAESSKTIQAMGDALRREIGEKNIELVLTNIGAPSLARSAMNSPNAGPHMGFIRIALADAEHRTLNQREIADRMRQVLAREFPGVETLQWPGGLVASVFSNGFQAPLVAEVRADSLDDLNEQLHAVGEVAAGVPGIRDLYPSIQTDYPELRVETDRQLASQVDLSLRQASQTTLEATLGNINAPSVWIDSGNGQSYYVVTSYDGHAIGDANGLAQLPVRVSGGGTGGAVTLGTYAKIRRSVGPIMIERSQLQRVGHLLMQTEGRDLGSAAAELEAKLAKDPRTKNVKVRFVGQVDLMRSTFSGLGIAIGLAIMVVFMIMASQFKSLRLPFVMLFTIPVSLVGIVMALMAAGQGFSITAFMGVLMVVGIAVSNGILLVDDANRRFVEDGATKLEAIIAAARSRFVPIAMTSLATVIGLIPTAMGLEAGTESNRPLALAVVGGLTSSTVLSLFLVPVMFMIFAKAPSTAPVEEGDEAESLPNAAAA